MREMLPGRVPAGTFTDDTEMALALADSLLAHRPLDPTDLGQRFVAWYQAGPDDVGIHTRNVLSRIAAGSPGSRLWRRCSAQKPDSAGNGSVMRCWPVALAYWDDLEHLLADSRLQSRVTHPHAECEAGSAFVNAAIYYLLRGTPRGGRGGAGPGRRGGAPGAASRHRGCAPRTRGSWSTAAGCATRWRAPCGGC